MASTETRKGLHHNLGPNEEVINALIEDTMLGFEDPGIMTCFLYLKFDGCGQGFGGYGLDAWKGPRGADGRREGTAYGGEFVRRILKTVGVDRWEKLKGRYVRIIRPKGFGGMIRAIGHIVEDQWFDPKADLLHLVEGADA